ncbi:DUF2267 domain-containing protein [Nitratireductor aquimarinus]|uniref:DUF2267 domain-containing protein n=1 Tax=Nitratireductor aquimarinus TaxID=889300 RepID=UPI00293623FE|nr:DUF2267 domain-containing protein [Nitratireductor aquimarinus]MDV2968350.1 DUF2267 domain-containing protein [Nitratireductor aquimarinus]
MGHPYDVEHATRLHVEWCRDLIDRTGLTTTNQTEPLMRAVMLELRRSIAPSAVIEIANALPALERGILLADWTLEYEPEPPSSAEVFHRRVYERVKAHHSPPESLTADVFWLWVQKLYAKKAKAVRKNLPTALLDLWPDL